MTKKEQKPNDSSARILGWVFGVLFVVLGLSALGRGNILSGVLTILGSTVLLPPTLDYMSNKWNLTFPGFVRVTIALALLVFAGQVPTDSAETMERETSNVALQPPTANPPATKPAVTPPPPPRPTSYVCDTGEIVTSKAKCPRPFSFNDVILAGDISWKFTDARRRSLIGNSEYFNKKANGEFLILDVEVTNNGRTAQTISDSYVKLVDSQGREYSPDSTAAMYLPGDSLFYEQINPGITAKGSIVFDVPKGLTVTRLRISNNLVESSFYYVNLIT
jgi:hypothetical protein